MISIMICQTNSVQGIQTADEEILLFQFADDATVFLDGTTDCFCSCIRILQRFLRFASFAGLRLNYDKSTAVRIGPRRHCTTKLIPELDFT